ncbi:MAG: bacillithiol biosynthesis BshC, partial [Planctomycetes bacterium]|nr:bacillithiol biosynthesis BshC [Planctomycetota bacterium]
LRGLCKHFGVKMPLMIPRAAGTVLKKSLAKTTDKLGLPLDKLIAAGWEWSDFENAASERGSGQSDAFDQFRENISKAFRSLECDLRHQDLQNLNELTREHEKFLGRVEGMEKRFRQQDPLIGENSKRNYFRLRKFVLPGETYQELSAWTVYFTALYGNDFIDSVVENTDPFTDMHHLFLSE